MKISKKLVAACVTAALLLFESKLGIELDAETKTLLVGLVSAYLIGQGVADFGKGKERGHYRQEKEQRNTLR